MMKHVFLGRTAAWLVAATTLPVWMIHRLAFRLDHILFPALRGQTLVRPLFIVGIPRSGTTALHRLIAENDDRFTSLRLWEVLLAPALCEKNLIALLSRLDRRLGRPIGRCLNALQRLFTGGLQTVHPTSLQAFEEDYLGLLAFNGCFLQVLLFPFRKATWELVDLETMQPRRRDRLLDTYRGILIRHWIFETSRKRETGEPTPPCYLLSKNPSMTSWVPYLMTRFPDAHVIALRRGLEQSLPSQLSSMRSGFRWFGHRVEDPRLVSRFREMYFSYWKMLDRYRDDLEAGQFALVDYEVFRKDPHAVVTGCLLQFDYGLTAAIESRLTKASAAMKTYRSQHHYSLDEFGLTMEEVHLPEPSDQVSRWNSSLALRRKNDVTESSLGTKADRCGSGNVGSV
ncbi:MAG: sulfotransferase [Planctomycetota bacterium]